MVNLYEWIFKYYFTVGGPIILPSLNPYPTIIVLIPNVLLPPRRVTTSDNPDTEVFPLKCLSEMQDLPFFFLNVNKPQELECKT